MSHPLRLLLFLLRSAGNDGRLLFRCAAFLPRHTLVCHPKHMAEWILANASHWGVTFVVLV